MPLSQAEFTGLIKDALTHFYSAVHLQSHRLSNKWPWQEDSALSRVEAVRQLLVTAIESLRPVNPAVLSSAEGMGYQVLRLRYLEFLSPEEVADSLGIGQTSYYRHHNAAMEALVSLLWDQYSAESASQNRAKQALAGPGNEQHAPGKAVRFAQEAKRKDVDLDEVLDGVRATILPLTERAQVSLSIVVGKQLAPVHADAVVVRQILLNVLTEIIGLPDTRTISMELCNNDGRATLRICSSAIGALEDHELAARHGIALGRDMAHALGGQLERGESTDTLVISLPSEPSRAILIIDDDRDTANLYSRYLQDINLSLHIASNRRESDLVLAEHRPVLIMLDVLMPEEDGWAILQYLQENPSTADIPVVICSVLSQPQLALALGANEVLQKPISREELLATVDRLVD